MRIFIPFLIALLTGCATGRSVIDVKTPTAELRDKPAVVFKVQRIEDVRVFELRPRQANIPSLKDGDIDNAATKARAVGRKRGAFGGARGDYVLPEAATVSDLVVQSLATAIARSGGVLVAKGDPRFATAVPLELRIDRFWSWLRPGAWAVQVEFDVEVVVKAPYAEFGAGQRFAAHAKLRKGAMTDERWRGVVESGLAELTDLLAKTFSSIIASSPVVTASPPPEALN